MICLIGLIFAGISFMSGNIQRGSLVSSRRSLAQGFLDGEQAGSDLTLTSNNASSRYCPEPETEANKNWMPGHPGIQSFYPTLSTPGDEPSFRPQPLSLL